MKVAIISHKGGVGKTTITCGLAGYLQKQGPTLAVDGDMNRSLIGWSERGSLPFKVVSEKQSPKYWQEHQHCVVDTQARPSNADLKDLSEVCDQLVVVTACDALSLNTLMPTVETLQSLGIVRYKVLLSMAPPVGYAWRDAQEMIKSAGLPSFESFIRRYVVHQRAALAGQLVSEIQDDHSTDAWNDIKAVGKELMKG